MMAAQLHKVLASTHAATCLAKFGGMLPGPVLSPAGHPRLQLLHPALDAEPRPATDTDPTASASVAGHQAAPPSASSPIGAADTLGRATQPSTANSTACTGCVELTAQAAPLHGVHAEDVNVEVGGRMGRPHTA